MRIVHPRIESYLFNLNYERDPLHAQIERTASKKSFHIGNRTIAFPIIGPIVGKIIFQLARLIQAKRVLELGSGFGYSGYWFAKALGNKGELYLTDRSQENLNLATKFLNRMDRRPKIVPQKGNALDLLDEAPGDFDIIFNDIDKDQYPEAFRRAAPRIRKGGLLITDNVLWSGKVLKNKTADRHTKGVQEFNRLIFTSKQFITTILPVRDGVAVCLKI